METHWKKLTNPNYLGSYSLTPGQDLTVTITKVVQEDVMNMNGKKEKAFQLGREAYINKKNRIVNQECINLLEEKPCKLNIEIMKNFYKGWDIENINNI